jgi:hypothetical protein
MCVWRGRKRQSELERETETDKERARERVDLEYCPAVYSYLLPLILTSFGLGLYGSVISGSGEKERERARDGK